MNTRVVDTKESINVVHRLCANVGELLDLSSDIFDLTINVSELSPRLSGLKTDLVVRKLESKLFDTALDSVPASETVTN